MKRRRTSSLGAAGSRIAAARNLAHNLRMWGRQDPDALGWKVDLALALAEPAVTPALLPNNRTIQRCTNPGSPRGVICSLAVDRYVNLLSISARTLFDYGERHGWDVVLSTERTLAEGRAISWAKLPLIRQLLDEYDLVWWVDADALIVDSSVDIRTELKEGKDLYLVEHWFPYPSSFAASAGIMMWRAGEASTELLDDLWSRTEHAEPYPWENGALLDALGYLSDPLFAHVHPTKYVNQLCLLPSSWNSVYSDPAEAPYVHHHSGNITFDNRRRLMLEDLVRVRRGEPPEMEASTPEVCVEQPAAALLSDHYPASAMSRDDIPALLNERGLTDIGVEVGTYAGEFSARLLRRWKGKRLISVDPWLWSVDYIDISNVEQQDYEYLYEAASVRLARFGERSEIWRLTSVQASQRIEDASLDFAYIDARHDETSVLEDLGLWHPKVRIGGIIAGHDYLDGELPQGKFGVKSAVDAYFAKHELPVHVTGDPVFPSWIVEVTRY